MSQVDVYLIRGLARESGHWGAFIPLLEKQSFVHSVSCLDLLGAGRFSKLTSPLSIRENAEFLISQMPKNNNRPRIIVSVSLGSMVAIETCQLQPEICSQLFVMNTSFSNLSPIYHRLQITAIKRFWKISRAQNLLNREKQVLKMVSNRTQVHDEVAQLWKEIWEKRPMKTQNFFKQLIAASLYKIADNPPGTPIVIFNSMEDKMVHPSCSEKLAKHWSLPIFSHPTAGHDICIDDPDWVIEKISSSLINGAEKTISESPCPSVR